MSSINAVADLVMVAGESLGICVPFLYVIIWYCCCKNCTGAISMST